MVEEVTGDLYECSTLYIFEVKTVATETGSGTMLLPKDVNILCTHMHLPSIGKTLKPWRLISSCVKPY